MSILSSIGFASYTVNRAQPHVTRALARLRVPGAFIQPRLELFRWQWLADVVALRHITAQGGQPVTHGLILHASATTLRPRSCANVIVARTMAAESAFVKQISREMTYPARGLPVLPAASAAVITAQAEAGQQVAFGKQSVSQAVDAFMAAARRAITAS